MTLLLNLHGAMHQLRNSTSNRETIETINRLTEELYRTVGILFFTRYMEAIQRLEIDIDNDLRDHIVQFMKKPTFDSWIRLGKISVELLLKIEDRFATRYLEESSEYLESDLAATAKAVMIAIQSLRSVDKFRPPKKINPRDVLEFVVHLRNYRSHAWDSEGSLQGLMDAGIRELIPALMDMLLRFVEVKILMPCSSSSQGIETKLTDGLKTRTEFFRDKKEASLSYDKCYIQYFEDEDPFLYPCNLLHYEVKDNLCFVYQEYRDKRKTAIFEAVPLQGNPRIHRLSLKNHEALFGIYLEQVNDVDSEEDRVEVDGKEIPIESIEDLPIATSEARPIPELIYSLFAQLRKGSTGIVAGSSLTKLQEKIYTETAMDRNFWSMLEEENPDLIIISGNAGDGKTTLMRMLNKHHGTSSMGREIKWNFDATHSDSASENQVDTLRRYFADFIDDKANDKPEDIHIIAMNTGMALSFFEEVKLGNDTKEENAEFSMLEGTVKSMMDIPNAPSKPTTSWKVLVIDLGRRALFNIDEKTEQRPSLISDLVGTLVGIEYWNHCPSCPRCDECFIIANIKLLRIKPVVKFLEYLVMRASFSSNNHYTIRDFWEFISEAVGGRKELHERLGFVLTERTCIGLIDYLVDWPLYGDLLSSLITNSPFQDQSFFDERSKEMFGRLSEILVESNPAIFSGIDVYSELTNDFAKIPNLKEAPRIFQDLVQHDPASLSGRKIDDYSELASSIILGPKSDDALDLIEDLLPQETHYMNRHLAIIRELQEYSASPDLRSEDADLLPLLIKDLTRVLVGSLKRRYVFYHRQVKSSAKSYDEIFSHDFITRFVNDVVLVVRDYVFDGSKKRNPLRGKLIRHLLFQLLPDAVMTSEGLGSQELLGLSANEFYISLDQRYNLGELAQYISATPVQIDGSLSDISLGRSFDKYMGCMATVDRYKLFDPVPMEVYIALSVKEKKLIDFKIDATTYGLISGVLEGRQPSIVEDARYRNFEVIKKKIRELAKNRSLMVYYDLYGVEVLRIKPDELDPDTKWKFEIGSR
ncbi:MAG: hypothetical protein ACFFER_03355 [Candidatus Thorarchaeota archaeon]